MIPECGFCVCLCFLHLALFPFYLSSLSYSGELVFVLSYYIMLCFIIIPEKPVCFLKGDGKGTVDLDGRGGGEELGGAEGEEIISRILCVKKTIFN